MERSAIRWRQAGRFSQAMITYHRRSIDSTSVGSIEHQEPDLL
jgi:hypothetical protein